MLLTDQRSSILRSERIAGGILPKVLSSFDMVAIFIAIVLWIPNSAVVAGAGAVAFIYWGLGFITCLIPGAIVTGQLGMMFPGEGSIYVWTTKAFGKFVGFLGGFCAWWPGILVMISAGDVAVIFIQNLGRSYGLPLMADSGSQGLGIILVITISFLLSILRFRLTQNLVNMIFLTYGSVIVLIGVAGLVWLMTGHHSYTDFSLQKGQWGPNGSNLTFYGTVILALLGIEVPLNMGVEIKDARSITRYLLWGSLVVMVAYLIVAFGVMIAVPAKSNDPNMVIQTNPTAVVAAILNGFGPLGKILATVANVFLIGYFVFVCAVYNYSYARLLFVSGLDRRLPIAISKINANKVPWIAVLAQSALAGLLTAFIFILPNAANNMYQILLAAATIFWSMSMVFLFIDIITIRRKFRGVFARVRLAPDWVFTLCAIVGTIANGVGIVVIFTAPWTNSAQQPPLTTGQCKYLQHVSHCGPPSAQQPPLTTGQWDAWMVGITIVALIVAVTVFFIGQQAIRKGMSDEELIAEVTR